MQQGTLKKKDDGRIDPNKPRIPTSWSDSGLGAPAVTTQDPDSYDFTPTPGGSKTTWETSFGWDFCNKVGGGCSLAPNKWGITPTTGRPEWENKTPRPKAPITGSGRGASDGR